MTSHVPKLEQAVCIASGPSLTAGDCARVLEWRKSTPGAGVFVTNLTFRMCPWADALYAMDNEWWRQYREDVDLFFAGDTYSRYGEYGTRRVAQHGHNSGAGALLLAAELGARRVVMLGYDCSVGAGNHWHADYDRPLHNCDSLYRWPRYFEEAARSMAGVEVLNASRSSALDMFPRISLEDALT